MASLTATRTVSGEVTFPNKRDGGNPLCAQEAYTPSQIPAPEWSLAESLQGLAGDQAYLEAVRHAEPRRLTCARSADAGGGAGLISSAGFPHLPKADDNTPIPGHEEKQMRQCRYSSQQNAWENKRTVLAPTVYYFTGGLSVRVSLTVVLSPSAPLSPYFSSSLLCSSLLSSLASKHLASAHFPVNAAISHA